MPAMKEFPVHGENGLRGVLLAPARFLDDAPERRIRLEDGREVTVPSNLLEPQRDGSFYLRTPPAESTPAQDPQATQEMRAVQPSVVQPSVVQPTEVQPTVAEPPMPPVPDEPLLREDCDIERVSIRKLIDKPAETRQDGDTLIVPLMEEVWVVEKKLMLREELHIRRKTIRHSDAKPVRREELDS